MIYKNGIQFDSYFKQNFISTNFYKDIFVNKIITDLTDLNDILSELIKLHCGLLKDIPKELLNQKLCELAVDRKSVV